MSSYINHYVRRISEGRAPEERGVAVDWELFTRRRLRWLYGADYAADRAAATNADLAAWNALGEGRRPAA